MPCLEFMLCVLCKVMLRGFLCQNTGSRKPWAPWIAPGGWDCAWCWRPQPCSWNSCSWSSFTLPPARRAGWQQKLISPSSVPLSKSLGVGVDAKASVGVIKIQPWRRTHEKSYSALTATTQGGLTAWPFREGFMTCLASCSDTTTFSGPCAYMICLMSHLNGQTLSISLLGEWCQERVPGICSCLQCVLAARNQRSCQGLA